MGQPRAYYVATNGNDANVGTKAQPWSSIQFAVGQIQPGDTIWVEPGEYTGQQTTLTRSGSPGNYFHIFGNNMPKLNGGANSAFLIKGDYWKIEGFDISQYAGDEEGAIDIEANHIQLKNIEIHNITGTGLSIELSEDILFDGGKIYDCKAGIFLDSTIHRLTVKNVNLYATQTLLCKQGSLAEPSMTFGIVNDWGASGSSYWTFENVSIRGVGWYGMDLRSRTPNFPEKNPITHLTLRNCTFVKNGNRYSAGGGWPWHNFPPEYYYGNALFQGIDSILVENSRFEDGGDWGIDFYKCSHIVVQNNVFLYNGSRTPQTEIGDGLEVNGGVNNRVFNNLFFGNPTAGLFLSYLIESPNEYHSATSLVANNIMWGNGFDLAIVGPGQAEPLAGKYFSTNTLYNNIYVTVDEFGPISSNGDLVGAGFYPQFVDTLAGNFQLLAGSPAIDAGWQADNQIPLKDFTGKTRTLPPDLGPYEFPGNVNKDSLIVSPQQLNFSVQGEAKSFVINTTAFWTISENLDWLTVESLSGTGSAIINATVLTNSTDQARTGDITVTSQGKTRVVKISQAGSSNVDSLIINPQKLSFSVAGESKSFTLTAAGAWSIVENLDWITLDKNSGTGNASINVTASSNPSEQERIGDISITSLGKVKTLSLSQAGNGSDKQGNTGQKAYTINFNGQQRRYIVYNPSNQTDLPLVLCFHGLGNTPENMIDWTTFNSVADTNNFIVAYPESNPSSLLWDPPTDVNYIDSVLVQIKKDYSVNSNRIYITGFSAGGFMTNYLGNTRSNTYAAIAPVEGGFLPAWNNLAKPSKGVPAMIIHNRFDGIVTFPSGIDARDKWIGWNGTNPNSVNTVLNNPTLTIENYADGRDNSEVLFYVAEFTKGSAYNNHGWPYKEDWNVSSSDIWKFFDGHVLDSTQKETEYKLQVNIKGQGSIVTNLSKLSFTEGTNVNITANPADKWRFTNWTGDASGTQNVISITMDSDKTITANFEEVKLPNPDPDTSNQTPDFPCIGFNTNWMDNMNWSSAMAFTNLFKSADPFKGNFQKDANGYPKSLSGNETAKSLVYVASFLPNGEYTLKWEGEGSFSLNVSGVVYNFSSGDNTTQKIPINRLGTETTVELTISSTNPTNYLKNFRLYLPGYGDSSGSFTTTYKDFFKVGGVIRMMDAGVTNNSTLLNWADRTPVGAYTYGGDDITKGVPYELMAELCNETNTHMWINIPHQANDDFVTQFARLVERELDPKLNVWVELSNEVWNGIFAQSNYFNNLNENFNLPSTINGLEITGQHRYGAKAVHCLEIFDNVFTNDNRIVGILGGQADFAVPLRLSTDAIQALGKMDLIDAMAIAPYFGVSEENDPVSDKLPNMKNAFDAIDQLIKDNFSNSPFSEIPQNFATAKQYNKKVVAYEGGQHFTSWDESLTADEVVAINSDPLIYDSYQLYLNEWVKAGGSTHILYTSYQVNSGQAFGHKTSWNQPISEAHKYRAIVDWLAQSSACKSSPNNFQVSPGSLSFSDKGGTETLSISSDLAWTASSSVSWLSIGDSSGSANATLLVTVPANPSQNVRNAIITLKSGGTILTVNVTQAAAVPNQLEVNPDNLLFTSVADSQAVNIKANFAWTATSSATWLSVDNSSGNGDATLLVKVLVNPDTMDRTANIEIISGNVSRTVTVTQKSLVQTNFLDVNPQSLSFSAEASSQVINISSDVSWLLTESLNWLSVDITSGTGNTVLTVSVDANADTAERNGMITINGGGITQAINITQSGAAAPDELSVNPSVLNFTANGYTQSVSVTSNLTWNIASDANWLSLSKNSSSNNENFEVTADENKDSVSRSAIISITGGGLKVELIVNQNAAKRDTSSIQDQLSVNVDTLRVNAQRTEKKIIISSNRSWEITTSVTWLQLDQQNGSANAEISVVSIANQDTLSRNGSIDIKAGNLRHKIIVLQEGLTEDSTNVTNLDDSLIGQIKLYPNPVTDGYATLDLPKGGVELTLQITDSKGQIVWNKTTLQDSEKIDLDQLSAGIYYLSVWKEFKPLTYILIMKHP